MVGKMIANASMYLTAKSFPVVQKNEEVACWGPFYEPKMPPSK